MEILKHVAEDAWKMENGSINYEWAVPHIYMYFTVIGRF
jgi:hypothetical protein